ncbi:MAG: type I phosphomannose isomerase catalytic subunit [Metamycoplasmataceae bacterium]
MNIIFLKPYFSERIWGSDRLKNFGFSLPEKTKIGEAWIISAIEGKSSTIKNVEGETLFSFFEKNKEFFGNYKGNYPLLTKIIDANDDLSIQVHPNNEYALKKHNSFGKAECWYILDAPENAELILGVNAKDRMEAENLIKEEKWDHLLKKIKIKKGDFIYVPPGMVHAITRGVLTYELQQSSDITYRLFDYNRLENGKERELHIKDSLNVIKYEFKEERKEKDYLIKCEYFNLIKKNISNEEFELQNEKAYWLEVTVIKGFGTVDNINIKEGDSFIIKHNHKTKLNGELEILIAYIEK